MNVDGYFRSMGNAIAKERTGFQILISEAENALTIWEIQSTMQAFDHLTKERGEPIAANLRGTLKNNMASPRYIESLTHDLRWMTKQGLSGQLKG